MAVVAGTGQWIGKGVHKWTVGPLLNGDQSTTLSAPNLPDKTIQVKGTFGVGASLQIEGSNDGGTTWHVVNDSRGEGNPMTFTTATGADTKTILENPELLRANVTAGDGTTSLTVLILSSSVR